MSDDLVRLLRSWHPQKGNIYKEAADRIEELETLLITERSLRRKATEMVISATIFIDSLYSTLQQIVDYPNDKCPLDLKDIARQALEDKKDV